MHTGKQDLKELFESQEKSRKKLAFRKSGIYSVLLSILSQWKTNIFFADVYIILTNYNIGLGTKCTFRRKVLSKLNTQYQYIMLFAAMFLSLQLDNTRALFYCHERRERRFREISDPKTLALLVQETIYPKTLFFTIVAKVLLKLRNHSNPSHPRRPRGSQWGRGKVQMGEKKFGRKNVKNAKKSFLWPNFSSPVQTFPRPH